MSKDIEKQLVTQVSLRNGDKLMTTWVDADSRLKPGVKLELKKVEGLWEIEKVFTTQEYKDFHGWDNNNYDKHTGLFS